MTGFRFNRKRHPHPAWVMVFLLAPSLQAVNPSLFLPQYLHTSWTQEEGSALPPIQALAQTTDGYLWLGTAKGLMRFDGMRFSDWSPASGPTLPGLNVAWLRPASSGGLWVGTTAGLCRVDRCRVIRYPSLSTLPCPVITSMWEDRTGALWMINGCPSGATVAVLSRDGSVRRFGRADGLPEQHLISLFLDNQNHIWLATSSGLCHWAPGTPAVCSKGPALDVSTSSVSSDGQIEMADSHRNQVFRVSNGQAVPIGPSVPEAAFSKTMLCDRDGNIWIGTLGEGLLRVRENGVDHFTRADGLSSNLVYGVLEDHEGDIWVATTRGIDRIRDPKVQLYSTLNGLSSDLITTVHGTRDGSVWMGTATGLTRLTGNQTTVFTQSAGLPDSMVLSSYEDASGRLWVATREGLAVQHGARFREVLTASGQHLQRVFNLGGDRSGTVWVADGQLGLFAVHGATADPVETPQMSSGDILALTVGRNGDIWLGHQHGGITVLCGNVTRHFDNRDGLGAGAVRALFEDRDGAVWAGTGAGLSRFRDSRWTTWTSAQGLPEGGVTGIVDDGIGGLWLVTSAGVVRVSLQNLEGAVKPLQPVLYGPSEGLRLANSMTNPRITHSRDGRIWLSTEDGAAAIDPARVRSNPVPPPVVIEQVVADGRPYNPAVSGETSFRGHDLQITYTGVSLMVPERVRFRYRLNPLDMNWTEAGTRRNVAYMNLPPGHYRFQVIASNNDGLWNSVGADFGLRVDPYFYQTTWFALLCLSTALLAVWFVHRMKVRRVVSRLQLVAAERVRFSRELHDSLLQGFSAVVFLLEASARQFETNPQGSKQRLDRALDQADQSLREAREMIASMRIPALENNTLPEALRTTISEMVSGGTVHLQFDTKGRAQQGPYDVEANLFLLTREAVTNALKHASPNRIRVELCYTPKELHVTIQDDGSGFDPEMAMSKAGHWGFRGMRERARLIGAKFTVNSAPGRGTTIDVGVAWKK